MNRDKRNKLVFLVAGTLLGLFLVWYLIIGAQQEALRARAARIAEVKIEVEQDRKAADYAERAKDDLELSTLRLHSIEDTMARGDAYRWLDRTFKDVKDRLPAKSSVEIRELKRPEKARLDELPRVDYEAISSTLRGTAAYHDFGVFIAHLESEFPFLYIRRIILSAIPDPTADVATPAHVLSFELDILALIRPDRPDVLP